MGERSPILRLYLLGTPRVEHAGQPYRILRRQVRALLYYLAEHQGFAAREVVAALFWPEMSSGRALRQLTQLLTHLRRQLPSPDLLVTTLDALWLAPEQVWTDVALLAPLAIGTPQQCQQTVDLYRGPFLDGFNLPQSAEFESWLLTRRHHYQRLYLECLAKRVERSVAFGDIQDAIQTAEQYLQVDDLAEGMHRRLIELFAAAGDEAAARRQYDLCRTILARELAIEPLAGTTEALHRVLQPARRPQLSLPPAPDRPVVGREAELACFESRLTALQQGRASLILLSGERGSGKSTLLYAYARSAASEMLTLYTRCLSAPLPFFGPLLEPLTNLLLTYEPQDHADLYRLAEISRLLPAIRRRFPALPAPLPDDSSAYLARLQDAISQIICQVARQNHGLVLLIDEVERADEGTLAVIQSLVAHVRGVPLLLVVSYCCSGGQPILQIQQGVELSCHLSEMRLGGLDEAAIGQLLRSIELAAGWPDRPVLASQLHELTGGNALFVQELLQIVATTRPDTLPGLLAEWPLPEKIDRSLLLRLSLLSPLARQLLEAAAVLGSRFTFEQARQTAGRSELEAITALDELVIRSLLVEVADGYRFKHLLACSVVASAMSANRRRLMQQRAAQVTALKTEAERHAHDPQKQLVDSLSTPSC